MPITFGKFPEDENLPQGDGSENHDEETTQPTSLFGMPIRFTPFSQEIERTESYYQDDESLETDAADVPSYMDGASYWVEAKDATIHDFGALDEESPMRKMLGHRAHISFIASPAFDEIMKDRMNRKRVSAENMRYMLEDAQHIGRFIRWRINWPKNLAALLLSIIAFAEFFVCLALSFEHHPERPSAAIHFGVLGIVAFVIHIITLDRLTEQLKLQGVIK